MSDVAPPRVLFDREIEQVPIAVYLEAIERFVRADAQGNTTGPPRLYAAFPTGSIAFTVGGSDQLAGFRAYEAFDSASRVANEQIVVVWDTETCRLKGVSIGERLGAIRTGALGGIAVDKMAARSARVCGIVGAGLQAETQLRAIANLRDFSEIRVFSRNADGCAAFVKKMAALLGREIRPAGTARECVEGADVVVLATNSTSPVIDPDWIGKAGHVSTVGPKLKAGHELPIALALRADVIASDSPRQIADQSDRHMLHGFLPSDRIKHLGALGRGDPPFVPNGLTLYLSAGLAGTEVVALDAALRFHERPPG